MTLSIIKHLKDAIGKHDRILVYTQDIDLIKDFLERTDGKWKVKVNEKMWDLPQCERATRGHSFGSYKISFVEDGHDVGLDEDARIVFTKNPFFVSCGTNFILKTHFKFPQFSILGGVSPLLAIRKFGQVTIRAANPYNFDSIHDQLVLQDIDHSIDSSGDHHNVHLARHVFKETGNVMFISDFTMKELFSCHQADRIVIGEDLKPYLGVPIESIKKIESVFLEMPDFALNESFISYKTWLNPKTVHEILSFLKIMKVVNPMEPSDKVLQIYKKGEPPKNDPLFHMIPEGEWSAEALAKHMKIPRQDVFTTLKKYENNGLIFAYLPKRKDKLWAMTGIFDEGLIRDVNKKISEIKDLTTNLEKFGEVFLNEYLEKKIQDDCLRFNSQAVIIGSNGGVDNINPAQTKL